MGGNIREPEISTVNPNSEVELEFNRLALRQTALLQTDDLNLEGWVIDQNIGLADAITLDQEALGKGTTLNVTNRPDVAKTFLNKRWSETMPAKAGIAIALRGYPAGNLIIYYPQKKIVVSLAEICALKTSEKRIIEGVSIYIDQHSNPGGSAGLHSIAFSRHISNIIQLYVKTIIPFIPILLFVIGILSYKKALIKDININGESTLFIFTITSSIFLPKALLLVVIDTVMFPGGENRYLASGAYIVWYTATYLGAVVIRFVVENIRQTINTPQTLEKSGV